MATASEAGPEPTQATREMYGDTVHGRQLLMARRLLEKGVRVVQVWHGDGQPWDSHDDIEENHRKLALQSEVEGLPARTIDRVSPDVSESEGRRRSKGRRIDRWPQLDVDRNHR